MNAETRSTRIFWIAGIVLLIGTVIGTSFALSSGAQSTGPDKSPPKHNALCIGYVDVEHGIANLYPTQPGEVVAVRDEGFHASAGDWLIKIDDQLARLRLAEAEAAFKEAQKLPEQHALKVKQAEQAILAATYRKLAADKEISAAERAADAMKSSLSPKETQDKLDAARARGKQIDCEIESAVIDKKLLELFDPNLKVKQVKSLYDQAKLGVDKCELRAVADGTLLRCLVHVGETLGTNPKAPAVQFAQDGKKIIRAEILQEWAGRFKKDQTVDIEDDSYNGPKWSGKIKSISSWYAHKRSIVFEPFTLNDVRSLECIVEVVDPDQTLRIGQRVRVGVVQ